MNKVQLPQTVNNLPTDALRMFVVLAEMKNISDTAQLISRSQPAVSWQLKKLEETLGATLIRRHKGKFNLTRNGEVLLHYAKEILTLNDRLVAELSSKSRRQAVRIGMPNDFIQRFWPNTLSQFQDNHPDISFEIYEDLSVNLINLLHKNQLDVVLAVLPKSGGQYCVHSVEKELFWVGQLDLIDHQPLPILSCFNGFSYRHIMEQALKKARRPFKPVLVTNKFYTIYDSIERGVGVYALLSSEKNIEDYQSYALPQLPKLQPLYYKVSQY